AAELNAEQIWELVKFVRWSLEQSDFRFLDWIDEGAFKHITLLIKTFAITKSDFNQIVSQGVERIEMFWADLTKDNSRIRDVAAVIIENDNLNKLTPPSKAELLDALTKNSSGSLNFKDPYKELINEASMQILETISSHRELVEVFKRIGNGGRKGSFHDFKTNYSKIIVQRLFRSPQSLRTEQWLSGVLG
ncbi:MAG TPA: hypothetical protein DC045_21935, partial [Marinobacter adhaerens]|nr:hypothetical protein [Marinobacter adhaerens]